MLNWTVTLTNNNFKNVYNVFEGFPLATFVRTP